LYHTGIVITRDGTSSGSRISRSTARSASINRGRLITCGSYTMPSDRLVGFSSVMPRIPAASTAFANAITRKFRKRFSSSPNSTVR